MMGFKGLILHSGAPRLIVQACCLALQRVILLWAYSWHMQAPALSRFTSKHQGSCPASGCIQVPLMPLVEIIRGTATSDAVSCLSTLLLPPGQALHGPVLAEC